MRSQLIREDAAEQEHPIAPFLRMDRIPHIWCPTCGIGTVVKCYATALEQFIERTGADEIIVAGSTYDPQARVRSLELIFGTTTFAVATVLAAFMGGLAS